MAEQEKPFVITYTVGQTPYKLDVFPGWDEELQESRFVVALDAEDIGTLRKTENDTWEWVSGGLDSVYVEGVMDEVDSAEEIGELIDSHYM